MCEYGSVGVIVISIVILIVIGIVIGIRMEIKIGADIGNRRLRIHVHGQASEIAAPSPLVQGQGRRAGLSRAAATVVAIGSAVADGCLIEVRAQPPVVAPREPPR